MFMSRFFMIHNPLCCRQYNFPKLSAGQQIGGNLVNVPHLDIKPWTDYSRLVEPSNQFHDCFVGSVIIDDFELSDVSVFLHHL